MIKQLNLTFILLVCLTGIAFATNSMKQDERPSGQVIPMTNELFIQQIFDYTTAKEWAFKGNKPVVIDFYATWCGPCRSIAPILNELAEEYKEQITFYKVDTDSEKGLSMAMGIRSLPTIVLIPINGQPQIIVGAANKETFKRAIEEVLLHPQSNEKPSNL